MAALSWFVGPSGWGVSPASSCYGPPGVDDWAPSVVGFVMVGWILLEVAAADAVWDCPPGSGVGMSGVSPLCVSRVCGVVSWVFSGLCRGGRPSVAAYRLFSVGACGVAPPSSRGRRCVVPDVRRARRFSSRPLSGVGALGIDHGMSVGWVGAPLSASCALSVGGRIVGISG